jgi:hypothetical protein
MFHSLKPVTSCNNVEAWHLVIAQGVLLCQIFSLRSHDTEERVAPWILFVILGNISISSCTHVTDSVFMYSHIHSSSLNRLRVPNQPSSLSYGPLSAILYRLFPGPRLIPSDSWVEEFDCLNRNARRGKKANHGKRPVSSVRRKRKTRTFGRKSG